jgi:NAD(P)-dependent dehydrogenase (short-subunit alcohol dehydrogenase family)
VAVTARTPLALDAVVSAVRDSGSAALAIPADLGLEADIQRIADTTLAHFGRIDILVNNAGIVYPRIDLVDFDSALWRQVIEVNLVAAALLTKAALPGMIAHRSGKILNVSSIGGRRGGKRRSAYRVTKAGLISLTESVAAEVKPSGWIRRAIGRRLAVGTGQRIRSSWNRNRLPRWRCFSPPMRVLRSLAP